LWSEWNGKYRDCVRHFWKGDGGVISEFATRFTGSSDLYEWSGRRPHASINFVTCHDGFTLHDLVSYDRKHNEQNGEDNRDGHNDNISWNCGVEGATDKPEILDLRYKKMRSMIATLILSQGVPMLLAGDETGNTQNGNNNAYCQDNEIAWLKWNLDERQQHLLRFTRQVIDIFHHEPVFHRRRFFHGKAIQGADAPEIAWLEPTGKEMTSEAWKAGHVRCLGVLLRGGQIDVDERGATILANSMLALFNADHANTISFDLPDVSEGEGPWELVLDTANESIEPPAESAGQHSLQPCSMALFRAPLKAATEDPLLAGISAQ
jgi:glycogen operon protein